MTMGYTYIVLGYMFSLVLFLNYNNPIFFWMVMELNLLFFLLILFMFKDSGTKQDSLNYLVFYFLIQSSSSILFLSNFSMGEWSSIFNCDIMFLSSLIFKLGLFPVFFWVFMIGDAISLSGLVVLMTFQKLPLLSSLFFSPSPFLLWVLMLSFLAGSIMVFFSNGILFLFLSSSISYSFMMFFLYSYSVACFFSFFTVYSLFLYICILSKNNITSGCSMAYGVLIAFIFFLGLPPLSLFFYKFIFSVQVCQLLGVGEMSLIWFFGLLSLIGYTKVFLYSFFKSNHLYKKDSDGSFKSSMAFWLTFLSFFMLVV